MELEDFIVLGRTVPEESKKYGTRVCMAGYSPSHGLRRVYPLTIDNPLRARHQAHLQVQPNPQDSRRESLKLIDAITGIRGVSTHPVLSTPEVCDIAEHLAYPSLRAMNQAQVSLGFLKMLGTPRLVWKQRPAITPPAQLLLFDEFLQDVRTAGFLTGKDYPRIPYLVFHDHESQHALQLREWGCFEYLRKHDGGEEQLGTILHLDQQQQPHSPAPRVFYALLGNMSHRRNVWLVIQLYSRLQHAMAQIPLFARRATP